MIQAEHQWPALCFKPAAQPSQYQAMQTSVCSVVTVVCLDVESTTSTESEKHILEVLQD